MKLIPAIPQTLSVAPRIIWFESPEQALAVREAEVAELRRTPMETKLRQVAALMEARGALGSDPSRGAEVEVVRERWARITRAMGVRFRVACIHRKAVICRQR